MVGVIRCDGDDGWDCCCSDDSGGDVGSEGGEGDSDGGN